MALNSPEVPWAPMLDFRCMLESTRRLKKLPVSGLIPGHWVSSSRFGRYCFLIPQMIPLSSQERELHHLLVPVPWLSILHSSLSSVSLVSSPGKKTLVKNTDNTDSVYPWAHFLHCFQSECSQGVHEGHPLPQDTPEPLSVHRPVYPWLPLANCV